MSKLNKNLPIFVALISTMVAASMLPSPAATAYVAADESESRSVAAPPPIEDDNIMNVTVPPEPELGFYEYLQECTKKLSRECGEKMVRSIFWDKDKPSTAKCCFELISLGKNCHDDMFKFLVSLPELRLTPSDVFHKADKEWFKCVTIAKSAAASPRFRI